MSAIATGHTMTEIDLRISDIGQTDVELGHAYSELVEQLDLAGQLDECRARVILAGLVAVVDAMRDTTPVTLIMAEEIPVHGLHAASQVLCPGCTTFH